jgi:branched-chain amino acid aminotransferase
MERLQKSVLLQKKELLTDILSLKKDIINLTKTEKKKEANIKIVFNYNNEISNYLIYIIESIYPTEDQYRTGIKGTLFPAERKTPESKVINHKLRSSIYHKLIMEGAYEALLVNEDNCITEGSRSNIFFIKDGVLFTAPDQVVLSGITRKYVIDLCNEQGIRVIQKSINVENLSGFDAVFMTGTSPMLLPFCCIDKYRFKVTNPIIKKLRDLYIKKAEESIKFFRADVTV